MDAWSIALFAGAAFLAVASLVRLMLRRRDEITAELRRQLELEQRKLRQSSDKKKAS